jgi:hypothetical protein
MGAPVFWRRVVDPEEDHAHVIDPKKVWKLCPQIFGDASARSLNHVREKLDALLPHPIRFRSEWIQRAFRMSSRFEKHACKLVIGLERIDIEPHNS